MAEQMVSAGQHEKVFNWLYDLAQTAPFDIKATAAPMYRRVAIERKRAENTDKPVTFQSAGFQYADGLHRPTKGVNDGNGFLFISHIGESQPSGFLPVTAGMVRENDIVDVYRNSQIFKDLRNPDKYKGCAAHANTAMYAAVNADAHTESLAIIWKAILRVCWWQNNKSASQKCVRSISE